MKKLLLALLVSSSLILSGCSSPRSTTPQIWKMKVIGSKYDPYSGKVECAYTPASSRYNAMGYVTIFLPAGEKICPAFATYNPATEAIDFVRNY